MNFKKLETFDSIYLRGKSHFEDDDTQNYLVFQTTCIKPLFRSNNILNPSLDYVGTKTRAKFKEYCLKQDKISFDREKIVNIYIVYETNKNFQVNSYPVLENCLFGAVKLKKHLDIDQREYSGYGIGFDSKQFFFNL